MSERGPSVPESVLSSIFITGRTTFVLVEHIRMVLKGERGFFGDLRDTLTGEGVGLVVAFPAGSMISTSLSEDLEMGLKNVELNLYRFKILKEASVISGL